MFGTIGDGFGALEVCASLEKMVIVSKSARLIIGLEVCMNEYVFDIPISSKGHQR